MDGQFARVLILQQLSRLGSCTSASRYRDAALGTIRVSCGPETAAGVRVVGTTAFGDGGANAALAEPVFFEACHGRANDRELEQTQEAEGVGSF